MEVNYLQSPGTLWHSLELKKVHMISVLTLPVITVDHHYPMNFENIRIQKTATTLHCMDQTWPAEFVRASSP